MDLSVFTPPLFLNEGNSEDSSSSQHTGPLIFNPMASSLTLLFSSPSLVPTDLLKSSHAADDFRRSSLQFLHCPGTSSVIVFFPTGDNSDRVGFLVLYVNKHDSKLNAANGVSFTLEKFNHRIINIVVVASAGDDCYYNTTTTTSSNVAPQTVGYLMASTCYGVHWFVVKLCGNCCDPVNPRVDFIGSKFFKPSPVMDACWNPHLPGEECLVLLETGELFLFHLDSSGIQQERLKLRWEDSLGNGPRGGWFCCMFSWHPRVIVVAHCNCVFLVDLMGSKECAAISILVMADTSTARAQDGQFVALSQAGPPDGFCFVVASKKRLLLCDVRRPLMPLLQWDHHVDDPCFINVIPLSELRSSNYAATKDSCCYSWASDKTTGYCIMMGSFWNCDFSLFCYGPLREGIAASSEVSKLCKPVCAWGLPMGFSISGRGCDCGDCILKGKCLQDTLPKWIDWRQKKEIVLGFGILGKEVHAKLSGSCPFGGFTLIRLMSSGRLESQEYHASWKFMNAHVEPSPPYSEGCLLYATGDRDYKFPKKFKYLKLDHLSSNELEGGVSADEKFTNFVSRPAALEKDAAVNSKESKTLKMLNKQLLQFLEGSSTL